MTDLSPVVKRIKHYVDELNAVLPHHWKGNDAPNPNHWDEGSITVKAFLDLPTLKAGLRFDFTEEGVPHSIEADLPLTEEALKNLSATIVLDGVTQNDGSVHFKPVTGLEGLVWYNRVVVEMLFKDADGKDHDYRFDGDLPDLKIG